jgi:hypothetical protein
MVRRTALPLACLLVLGLLAGCSAVGSLEMHQAANDTALAEQVSRSTAPPERGPTRGRELVREAIENGSAIERSRGPLVDRGLPFAHEGRYYNVSWNVTARQPGTDAEIAFDYNGTAAPDETVAYENLSARDREAIDQLFPPLTDHRENGYEVGVGIAYTESERNRSVLLAEKYEAVRYEGETYPVRVSDTERVTIKTYRYTATVVANSSAEYASLLRGQYLFTLSNLSNEEQQVVETAITDGETYYAEDTDDQAFRSIMERFGHHEAIHKAEYEGTWLVRYEGEVYVAELDYGGFDEDERP